MSVPERDIVAEAFELPEWKAVSDALFQATGVVVSVMDFGRCVLLAGGQRCSYCHLATDMERPGPLTCFDSCPPADAGPGRIVCRAGLAALYAPVRRGEQIVAHAVVSGFVTSTRERRGLYEHLITKGVGQDPARKAIKTLPVIARRQVEAYLSMAVANAETVLTAHIERVAASERIEELKLFVNAGQQVVATDRLDPDVLATITEEAVSLIGGEAGAILRPRGAVLEVIGRTNAWRGPLGAKVPRRSTASGRAVETRRTVVAPGKDGVAILAMPLTLSERVLGVLEVRLPRAVLPLPQDRVARLSRFGRFIAIAVEREDERRAVERAMAGYAHLNELAAALGAQSDTNAVARLISDALRGWFSHRVAGFVFTGWGADRVDVVLNGDVPRSALDELLGQVAGRDVGADPFGAVNVVGAGGSLVEEVDGEQEWSLATANLRHGDLEIGHVFVAREEDNPFGSQDHALLEGVAAHGGAAFGRAALFGRIRDDYAKTIAALSATLDLGERATSGHASRVMDYAMMIGEELGLGYEAIDQLRFAGLLHDVGKAGIPEEILLKPSRLTDEELAHVRRHVEIGASIVDQIEFLKSLTPIILHHHERWDGKGYPQGISGESIPLLARVLCVADAFDAMTSERTYAKRLSVRQARMELEAGVGTQFDPRVVAAFLDGLDRMALAGSTGLLASHMDLPSELPS